MNLTEPASFEKKPNLTEPVQILGDLELSMIGGGQGDICLG